jgi:hypothetical protein
MGLKGARLGDKAARVGCRGDSFLKQKQFWREPDAREENSSAIETAKLFKANGNGWRMDRAQTRDYARVLFRGGIAQKLQGDVPGFGRRPAKPVCAGTKPRRGRTELVDYRCRQRYPDEKAHSGIIVSGLLASMGSNREGKQENAGAC